MFLAGIGSVIAMLITASIIFYYKSKEFLKEISKSMAIKKGILGEREIKRFLKMKRKLIFT